ncbi:MAG: hypothetical protein JST17_05010 [Bacteroidetes bacterium]|nr:hypothetical protein [Bacteroidota bacterium]MBS1932056.1 hypothetical protein [Bacteroidota bacterium]
MEIYKKALSFDTSKDYVNAVIFYEQSISANEIIRDAFINLSFIYWHSAAEFAWADYHNIPHSMREKGAKKYQEIIKLALKYFPDDVELHFWEKYFPHRLFFDPLTQEEVLHIVWRYSKKSLVPYFFLYLFDKVHYKRERDKLLLKCNEEKTAKNIYIATLIR